MSFEKSPGTRVVRLPAATPAAMEFVQLQTPRGLGTTSQNISSTRLAQNRANPSLDAKSRPKYSFVPLHCYEHRFE
jgi:hypothetical protein